MTFLNEIICGDALESLRLLPDESVDCCITSPPYFGLRDYMTASWEGGEKDCDHLVKKLASGKSTLHATAEKKKNKTGMPYTDVCSKCGAVRIDRQIGLEKTPGQYIQKLCEVFSEVRRVLKKEGTLWVNIGDSYAGSGKAGSNHEYQKKHTQFGQVEHKERLGKPQNAKSIGCKSKDLIGIPWMLAFALRSQGWYLRQDIIWAKAFSTNTENNGSTMPESVTDRFVKSHEYIFLLSKSAKYYFDLDAVKKPIKQSSVSRLDQDIANQKGSYRVPGKTNGPFKPVVQGHPVGGSRKYLTGEEKFRTKSGKDWVPQMAREGTNIVGHSGDIQKDFVANKRSVWHVNPSGFKEAHFATFPQDLITDIIKAACPKDGIVLDPFAGTNTTGIVARKLLRNFISIELNPDYVKLAHKRTLSELGLFLNHDNSVIK
jgi:DNA modification methylase